MPAQITISHNVKAVLRTMKRFRVQTIPQLRDETAAIVEKVMRLMQKPGAPSTSPVNWDSERQRRFVLAKLRLANNLPYSRSNQYINGWSIQETPHGTLLKNPTPGSLYISGGARGDRQSNIHKNRWTKLRDAVDAVMQKTPQYIAENLRKLVKRD